MASLRAFLFRRPRNTCYARLDSAGNCLAFKQCDQPPGGSGWVQVSEVHLGWLGCPLPASARVCASANSRWRPRTLLT
ncbi:MAG TPA: hypothetical protein VJS90_12840 [Pseudomonas sp.]|nr:hypothetical protein [Pseudomonas sp.]HKS13913.1 hypothetical protein [Pseudomonas sp.]